MNIALCDDEKIFIDKLSLLLDKISFQQDIDLHIDVFFSGEEFLQALRDSSNKYDLVFLDILMQNLNGIETAKKLREFNNDISIVFLTSTIDFALSGYDVKALNYLIKPVNYEKVQQIVLDLYNSKYDKNSFFNFNINQTLYSIPLDDINYFEIKGRIVNINAIKNKYIEDKGFYKKFEDLEKELENKNFIRCHRSYLVNLKNINAISPKEIIFTNNENVPVSRRLYKKIKDTFLEYVSSLI